MNSNNIDKLRLTKKGYLWLTIVVIIIALLFTSLFAMADWNGWGANKEATIITIPKGATVSETAKIVKDKGIISSKTLFQYFLKTNNAQDEIKPGEFELEKNMSYKEILAVLSGKPIETGIKITIPEGFENRQIADKLQENGICNSSDFLYCLDHDTFNYSFLSDITRTADKLEGYLFPATYTFKKNSTPHNVADKMLSTFQANWKKEYTNRANELDYSIDKIVTLASIVEREAGGDIDRDKVASVFWNRLNKPMRLESCATVQYVLKTRKPVLSYEDTHIVSPYNTYQNDGLPIGPIANPGIKSIEATLYPAQTDYYFFFFDGTKHIFSKTYAEHQAAQGK